MEGGGKALEQALEHARLLVQSRQEYFCSLGAFSSKPGEVPLPGLCIFIIIFPSLPQKSSSGADPWGSHPWALLPSMTSLDLPQHGANTRGGQNPRSICRFCGKGVSKPALHPITWELQLPQGSEQLFPIPAQPHPPGAEWRPVGSEGLGMCTAAIPAAGVILLVP